MEAGCTLWTIRLVRMLWNEEEPCFSRYKKSDPDGHNLPDRF